MSLLKKHWQKFIIASFASFWAGCNGDSESSAAPLPDNCTADICEDIPSSSEATATTSSSEGSSSSSEESSSSSYTQILPLYGVFYSSEAVIPSSNCTPTKKTTYQSPACYNDMCPEYGVEMVEEDACECNDGKTYTVEEYMQLFNATADEAKEKCNPGSSTSEVNCYKTSDKMDSPIECDNGETFATTTGFAETARSKRVDNALYAANCSTVSELCVDRYNPETQTNEGGCLPDIACPQKDEQQ